MNHRVGCRSSTASKRAPRVVSRRSKSIAPTAPQAITQARWSLQRSRSTWKFHVIACSGQALTQALQCVQTSRSIGFSCVHCASNAPSQPSSRVNRPETTGKLRVAGKSVSNEDCVDSTVTDNAGASASAHFNAAASGPTISNCPSDLYPTDATGSGSGSAAAASSAAILGVARDASADHPAVSRILTKRMDRTPPASSARSPSRRCSCVHATTMSPDARFANSPAPCWHIAVCTCRSVTPVARASASRSSGIVALHVQIATFLSETLMCGSSPASRQRRSRPHRRTVSCRIGRFAPLRQWPRSAAVPMAHQPLRR